MPKAFALLSRIRAEVYAFPIPVMIAAKDY
jgi:hypothetical protein